MMIDQTKSLKPGFSIVELLISLGIIMLIMSFIVPGLAKIMGKGSLASTKNTLKIVNQAILDYKMDVHIFPAKIEDLYKRPAEVQGWSGPYIEETTPGKGILDAWHQPIVYKKNERGSKKPYELYSNGDPDKEEDRIDA